MTGSSPLRVVEGGRAGPGQGAAPAPPGGTGGSGSADATRERRQYLPVIPPRSHANLLLIPGVALSLLVHGVLVTIAIHAPKILKDRENSIVQMFVIETPPEPEPETEPEPEPEPDPEPEVIDYQDAVVMEEAPPEDAQPADEPAPQVFGVSMSSTVSGGGSWSVQVGNTVAIAPEDSAQVDPSQLTPVVAYQFIEREPVVIKRHEPAYPEAPKAAGIEGDVLLYLTIDEEGNVVEARVVRGPHPELNEAARRAMFRHKFRPATKGGRTVVVEKFPYQFTWIIEE